MWEDGDGVLFRTVLDIRTSHAHPVISVGYIHTGVLEVLDDQLRGKHVEVEGLVDAGRGPVGDVPEEEVGDGGRARDGLGHEGAHVQPPDKELKRLGVVLGHGDLALDRLLEAAVEGGPEEVGHAREEVLVQAPFHLVRADEHRHDSVREQPAGSWGYQSG